MRSPAATIAFFALLFVAARAQSIDVDARLKELAAHYDARSRDETLKLVEPLLDVATLTDAQRAEALRIKGNALVAIGKSDDAVATLKAALAALESTPDERMRVRVQLSLASAYRGQKKLDLALAESQTAEAAIIKLGDEELLLECLASQLYYTSDRDGELIQRIAERALPLADKLGNPGAKGRVYHLIADREFTRGEYAAAVRHLEMAVSSLRAAGVPEEMPLARALTSLGRARRAHGLPARALDAYREAMAIQRRTGDRLGVVQSWNAMGVAWANLDKLEKALECYRNGLAEARGLGDPSATQFMEGAVATALLKMGKPAEAIPVLETVLAKNPEPYIARFRLAALADAYLTVGRAQDALTTIDRALAMDSASMPDAVGNFQFTRARANAALGRQDDAITDARRSLDTFERIRQSLVPLDFVKRGYSDLIQDIFDFTVGALEASGRRAEAVATAEEGRGRALADLLASRMTPRPVTATNGATDRNAATLLAGAATADAAPAGLDSPVATRALSTSELTALAAAHRTAIVSYWVGADRSLAWVIRGDGSISSATLPVTRARLRQLVDQASRPPVIAIEGDASRPDPALRALRALHDTIVTPIATFLPPAGGRLTIVPHGPLHALTFSALRSARGSYLIERYTLHDVPSGAVLALAASRPARQGHRWVLVADPQPRPDGATALPPLPQARREIAAAAASAPGEVVQRLAGTAASERAFRSALADARLVHIAAHAVVPPSDAAGAFLAFGRDRTTAGDGADGRLTAAEIYDLRVGADLVVLSACRSGRGRITADGVAGFTRAFISAGARTVVASLWDAPDESARRLMTRFYARLQHGDAPADALRGAQVALLADLRAGRVKVSSPAGDVVLPPHPALWAGFRVHGVP